MELAAQNHPRTIGRCADKLYELRQARIEKQREVEALAKQERGLREHIIASLPKSEASGVAGKLARVTVVTKEEPVIKNISVFRRFLRRSKRHDLAYKLRPSAPGIREIWESGEQVPGIEKFTVVTLSLSKVA